MVDDMDYAHIRLDFRVRGERSDGAGLNTSVL
jgi:hypothetical protein